MGQDSLLLGTKFNQRSYVLFRYHQEVGGCLGTDVPESNDLVILMEDGSWHLASYDIAKDTLLCHLKTQLVGYQLAVEVGITKEDLSCFTSPEVEL